MDESARLSIKQRPVHRYAVSNVRFDSQKAQRLQDLHQVFAWVLVFGYMRVVGSSFFEVK